MAAMITKLYTTHAVVYVHWCNINMSYLLNFGRRTEKKIKFMYVFGSVSGFGFGVYVKAVIDFKAF